MSLHRLICKCCSNIGVGLDLTLPTYINCLVEFTDEAGSHSFDLILKKDNSAACSYRTYIGDLALCDEYPHTHYAITRPGYGAGNASSTSEICISPCGQGQSGMAGGCTNEVSTSVEAYVTRDSGFNCRCWTARVVIYNYLELRCFSACTVQTLTCNSVPKTGITARGITNYTSKIIKIAASDYVNGSSASNIMRARTNTGGTATYCPNPNPCVGIPWGKSTDTGKNFVCNANTDGLFSVYTLPATTPYCTTRSAVSGGNSTTYAARNIPAIDVCATFPTISLPGQTVTITNVEVYA